MAVNDTSDASEEDHRISSVANALALIEMFMNQRTVRVSEASRHLGVARSTAHRLLQTLKSQGYVEQHSETRVYSPGPTLVRVAVSVVRDLDIRSVARPIMADLVSLMDETVHLSVLRGSETLFIESIETSRPLRVGVRTGLSVPAHATASGRVLLAELSTEQLHKKIPLTVLDRLTDRTIAGREELEAVLRQVREQGFATSIGESEDGVASVAVPIRNSKGGIVAALAVSAPPSRLSTGDTQRVAVVLAEGAERIRPFILD